MTRKDEAEVWERYVLIAVEHQETEFKAHEERFVGIENLGSDCWPLRVSSSCREWRLQEASRRPLLTS